MYKTRILYQFENGLSGELIVLVVSLLFGVFLTGGTYLAKPSGVILIILIAIIVFLFIASFLSYYAYQDYNRSVRELVNILSNRSYEETVRDAEALTIYGTDLFEGLKVGEFRYLLSEHGTKYPLIGSPFSLYFLKIPNGKGIREIAVIYERSTYYFYEVPK